jgi:hypothetical protein
MEKAQDPMELIRQYFDDFSEMQLSQFAQLQDIYQEKILDPFMKNMSFILLLLQRSIVLMTVYR